MGGKAHGGRRINRAQANELLDWFGHNVRGFSNWMVAGSYRRGKEELGDLDLVVLFDKMIPRGNDNNLFECLEKEFKLPLIPPSRSQVSGLIDGVQVEVYICEDERNWGSFVQMWSGSMFHNIKLRSRAKKMGYSLSQYGAKALNPGARDVHFSTEEALYKFLEMDYIQPENRG
jgi:DNA polymerase (family 10)